MTDYTAVLVREYCPLCPIHGRQERAGKAQTGPLLCAACSPWYGPERPRWLGPLPAEYPAHLQGEAPADYGYDIAGLGTDPAAFDRNFELELLHGRWAMLSALGILVPGQPHLKPWLCPC